jgi:hypothetical protein
MMFVGPLRSSPEKEQKNLLLLWMIIQAGHGFT